LHGRGRGINSVTGVCDCTLYIHEGIRAPTAQTILSLSIAELKCLTSLSIEELLKLRRNAALFLRTTTPSTLLDIWMGHREDLVIQRLTTGCSSIDQVLEGGLLSRGVTEIAGESGAGKTQLCLQLCLTVQLPQTHGGFEGAAMYISTEDVFPHKRLHQLAPRFLVKHRGLFTNESSLTDKIYIEHAATSVRIIDMSRQYSISGIESSCIY
jgi:DNA-repair protein XRCC3